MKMVSMSVGMPSISKCFLFNTGLRTPTTRYSVNCTLKLSLSASVTNMALPNTTNRKLPILLFDIMDTLVRDPFYEDVPAFFGMSFKELIDCKHPTAWLEFEKGSIDEMELARIFFKDGRDFDLEGLKTCMRNGYSYIDGIEQLLFTLKQNNFEMHAFTNYPTWYQLIEDKLKLSTYLSWTFCSCTHGKRKPDTEFYMEALRHLKVDPASCIFVDDRKRNVEAATEVGIRGVQFKNVNLLREELSLMGVDISIGQDR
uniref:FCP1 homology domain-containing protein n=1 Tax=Lotus japonicus TaxID=34305 RepID=I3SMA5_LOTJA|nr:unknown [Lotus japonicus]